MYQVENERRGIQSVVSNHGSMSQDCGDFLKNTGARGFITDALNLNFWKSGMDMHISKHINMTPNVTHIYGSR